MGKTYQALFCASAFLDCVKITRAPNTSRTVCCQKVITKRPSYPVAKSLDANLDLPANLRINPKFTYSNTRFEANPLIISPNGFARYILLTDGHLPQHLSIISQGLTMRHASTHIPSPPSLQVSDIHCIYPFAPIRRTVIFVDSLQRPLLYSTSTWCPEAFQSIMSQNQNLPIWLVFAKKQVHLSRRLLAVHYGICPQAATFFGYSSSQDLWARDVIFRQQSRPFLFIHQILSPAIEQYVGPMQPSSNLPVFDQQLHDL